MEDFVPTWAVLLPALVFSSCRFENQRWMRLRMGGLRGSSQAVGAFIDGTGMLALLFGVLFLASYWHDAGWRMVVGLIAISQGVGIIYSLVSSAIFRGDNFFVMAIATVAIWPVAVWLAPQTTWFGFI